ncbi:MAG: flagellin [Kiritimatiellae bacterium]|nr:flagellin [Kiritimatiellia bacterium]MDD4734534.1 flagellin [Kiritimatiellia bacterium]
MQVYNNISAFSVWKNYNANVTSLRNSMSKLSSGLRINNAGDDPSGLAMSERLRTQYRNTSAATTNVENKINYLQTSDAWLQKIQDMMGRMGELAVMANDGTKSQVDRDNLQKEFSQMQKEITRITSGATAAGKFNGLYLFRGGNGVPVLSGDGVETGSVRLQIGPDSNMVFTEEEVNLTATNFAVVGSYTNYSYGSVNMTLLGSGSGPRTVRWASIICGANLSISTQSVAQGAVDKINIGIDYVSSKRAVLGAEMKRMEQTLSGLRSYEENVRATESRIRDVDVAYETTQYSKYQILVQVGTAMLAQANALPNSVVQMLG